MNIRRNINLLAIVSIGLAQLAACGGGSHSHEHANAVDVSTTGNSPTARIMLAPSGRESSLPGSIQVEYLSLIGSDRVSRTVFDYSYKISVTSRGRAIQGATLRLIAAGQGTTIIDGVAAVGAISEDRSRTTSDSITLRQDRQFAFDPTRLRWEIRLWDDEVFDLLPGVDANGDGVRDDVETFLREKLGSSPDVLAAALMLASGLQKTVLAQTDSQQAAAEIVRRDAALCLVYRTSPATASSLIAQVHGKQWNTPERLNIEMRFRAAVARKIVKIPNALPGVGSCA